MPAHCSGLVVLGCVQRLLVLLRVWTQELNLEPLPLGWAQNTATYAFAHITGIMRAEFAADSSADMRDRPIIGLSISVIR